MSFHFLLPRPCPSAIGRGNAGNNQGQLVRNLTPRHLQSFSRGLAKAASVVQEQRASCIGSQGVFKEKHNVQLPQVGNLSQVYFLIVDN